MITCVEQILHKFKIEYKSTKAGRELQFNCICPDHKDRNASAFINTASGLWHCFSCLKSGNMKTFVRIVSGDEIDWETIITPSEALKMKIGSIYKTSIDNILAYENDVDFIKTFQLESKNFVPATTNKKALTYLLDRGFTKETIKRFDLQFSLDGNYENRVIIPYYMDGQVIGMNSRFAGECSGKDRYRYFLNQTKFNAFLYNYDNIADNNYCILVEGPFDLMYMVQSGYKNVISTLNTNITPEHMEKIMNFKKVIFCFDNDEVTQAGQTAIMKHASTILEYVPDMPVFMVPLPNDTDPNDCSEEQLKECFSKLKRIKVKAKAKSLKEKLTSAASHG